MKSLTLHHNNLSTYTKKVRLTLSAKKIECKLQLIDLECDEHHQKDYVKLQPNHVVPILVDNK